MSFFYGLFDSQLIDDDEGVRNVSARNTTEEIEINDAEKDEEQHIEEVAETGEDPHDPHE